MPTNPDPEYQTYEVIDLTPYLKPGANTITALVYNAGEGMHHRMDARGGFFFQARIIDQKGKVIKLNSDKKWRMAQAIAWDSKTKHRQNDHTIGMHERYDARLAYEGWEQPSFNDSDWEKAKEIGVPPWNLGTKWWLSKENVCSMNSSSLLKAGVPMGIKCMILAKRSLHSHVLPLKQPKPD